MPGDLLFEDDEECWIAVYEQSDEFDKDVVCDYLSQYQNHGLQRFIANKIDKWNTLKLVEALKRRNIVF